MSLREKKTRTKYIKTIFFHEKEFPANVVAFAESSFAIEAQQDKHSALCD
jgi:hypothetical protein